MTYPDENRTRRAAERAAAMTDRTHKFRIGQTVDLIPSTSRSAARGNYEIVSLRPADGESPQYRIKSRSDSTSASFRRATLSCRHI